MSPLVRSLSSLVLRIEHRACRFLSEILMPRLLRAREPSVGQLQAA
jgi:hypothetical protein